MKLTRERLFTGNEVRAAIHEALRYAYEQPYGVYTELAEEIFQSVLGASAVAESAAQPSMLSVEDICAEAVRTGKNGQISVSVIWLAKKLGIKPTATASSDEVCEECGLAKGTKVGAFCFKCGRTTSC